MIRRCDKIEGDLRADSSQYLASSGQSQCPRIRITRYLPPMPVEQHYGAVISCEWIWVGQQSAATTTMKKFTGCGPLTYFYVTRTRAGRGCPHVLWDTCLSYPQLSSQLLY